MKYFFICCCLLFVSCELSSSNQMNEKDELEQQSNHPNPRMRFKLIDSKFINKNSIWEDFDDELVGFKNEYISLKPFILEKSIPEIQSSIQKGNLTYEQLVKFFIYRIRLFENNPEKRVNAIIALNPNVLEQARQKDELFANAPNQSLIFGMPVLLKDNINTKDMPTTAGAAILATNRPNEDAFVVNQLKQNGALILGKVNLSEWAYYFCTGCPLGYSAIGGQTLNPYGPKVFESGGSSSGSGVAVAVNYAVAAVGSETSGSILSPSSKNSVVGLKPTIGMISRSGVVPISPTLDTTGPMTKFVVDNMLLYEAMLGNDPEDVSMKIQHNSKINSSEDPKTVRIGAFRKLAKSDSLYRNALKVLINTGNQVVMIDPPKVDLDGFLKLLNFDMKNALPEYLNSKAFFDGEARSVSDIIQYNLLNMDLRAPYGQQIFENIERDTTAITEIEKIKKRLKLEGRHFFQAFMNKFDLDAVVSVNNNHASYAAVAHYPALTVPMGYTAEGEPKGLTFIAPSYEEQLLYTLAIAYEKATDIRQSPNLYP